MKICTGCGKNEGTVERLSADLCQPCYDVLQQEHAERKQTGPRFFASYTSRAWSWLEWLLGVRQGQYTVGIGLYISQTPAEAMAEAQRMAKRNGWILLRLDIQRTLTDIYRHKDFHRFHYGCKPEPVPFDTAKYGEIPA